jgi:YebC/PmpR family DNA-binding regulatory protein
MGRAFEYRKASKLKRWGNMARTFTRIGKQIAIAVKAGGPDPENNPHLRAVIANAKRENMPKDNVQRAIKNAMGKDQKDYKEMNYEGYGPFGVAIYVETATDNTTRTVANVRAAFNKFEGSLGTSGSLDFIFDHKSMFTFKGKENIDMDELILELIDYGVEDEYDEEKNEEGETEITIYGDPKAFSQIQHYLEDNNFEVTGSEFTRIPNNTKTVTPEQREKLEKLINRLEDDEDVQNVYSNIEPEAAE